MYSETHNHGIPKSAQTKNNDEGNGMSHMLELEQRRFEAVRRRQEKELMKIVQREQAMVTLQAKLKKSEDEEIRKKKQHEKKVTEQKIQADKKKAQRAKELAEKVMLFRFV